MAELGIAAAAAGYRLCISRFDPWSYRSGFGYSDRSRLDGYKVLAPGGEVEDASYPPGAAALVVDTGLWILGQHVLLPAGVVEYINHHTKEITVDTSESEIKAAPPYEADSHQDPGYRDRVTEYYACVREAHRR